MSNEITVEIEIAETTWTVEIDCHGQLEIYRDSVWACSGVWSGQQIEDASAPLGEEVYEALEEAIAAAL